MSRLEFIGEEAKRRDGSTCKRYHCVLDGEIIEGVTGIDYDECIIEIYAPPEFVTSHFDHLYIESNQKYSVSIQKSDLFIIHDFYCFYVDIAINCINLHIGIGTSKIFEEFDLSFNSFLLEVRKLSKESGIQVVECSLEDESVHIEYGLDREVYNSISTVVEYAKATFSELGSRLLAEASFRKKNGNLLSRFHAHNLKNSIHIMDGVIATSESLIEDERKALNIGLRGIRESLDLYLKMNLAERGTTDFPSSQITEYIELLYKSDLKRKKVELVVPQKDYIIRADFRLVLNAFINLMSNAIKAVKEESERKEIEVEFAETENQVVAYFKDTGIGIDKELQDKLFLERIDSEIGEGIGLLDVRYSLESTGGSIEYLGSQGEFSTVFKIKLPKS